MIELRFHNLGRQDGVTASKLLAVAIFKKNHYVQALSSFGVERRSASVTSFTSIDDQPIRICNLINESVHIIILAPSLIGLLDVTQGMKPNGTILII